MRVCTTHTLLGFKRKLLYTAKIKKKRKIRSRSPSFNEEENKMETKKGPTVITITRELIGVLRHS